MRRTKAQIKAEAAGVSNEFVYDQINGSRGKKSVLSALNKNRLSSFEMDEIFAGDDWN